MDARTCIRHAHAHAEEADSRRAESGEKERGGEKGRSGEVPEFPYSSDEEKEAFTAFISS